MLSEKCANTATVFWIKAESFLIYSSTAVFYRISFMDGKGKHQYGSYNR